MSMEKLPIIPKNTVVELQADRFAVGGQEISFLEDSDFVNAWNEVMDEIKPKVDDDNIKKSFWRAHVVNTLFVNSYRPGCCYVECGTNLGIMSRMVFKLNREKSFKKYLFDTWQGIPESQFSDDEPLGTWHKIGRAHV